MPREGCAAPDSCGFGFRGYPRAWHPSLEQLAGVWVSPSIGSWWGTAPPSSRHLWLSWIQLEPVLVFEAGLLSDTSLEELPEQRRCSRSRRRCTGVIWGPRAIAGLSWSPSLIWAHPCASPHRSPPNLQLRKLFHDRFREWIDTEHAGESLKSSTSSPAPCPALVLVSPVFGDCQTLRPGRRRMSSWVSPVSCWGWELWPGGLWSIAVLKRSRSCAGGDL